MYMVGDIRNMFQGHGYLYRQTDVTISARPLYHDRGPHVPIFLHGEKKETLIWCDTIYALGHI